MEQINICLKEKRVFYKYLWNLLFFIAVIFFIYMENKNSRDSIEKTVEAFNNNQEIICDKKIVSKQKGYNFYEKDNNYIANGENMFLISRCSIKE